MYDPDPASPVLRLGDTPAKPAHPAPRTLEQTERWLAEAEQAMEEAIKRWSSAYVDWTAMRAQARPIPASQPTPIRQTDAQHLARYTASGSRPLVFRANGKVEALG